MPILSINGLSFSGLAWTFKLPPSKVQRTGHGMLGHWQLHFKDQHMVMRDDNS
jgi:hypothetical protein